MQGRLSVRWERLDDGACRIVWQEMDGPTVQPPAREGFGSVLIRRSIPFDLGGKAVVDYAPEGLRAEFEVPARFISWAGQSPAPQLVEREEPTRQIRSDLLEGRHVLVVEDQFLIALDLEDELQSLAAASVDVVGTVADALALVAVTRPHLAILDVDLGGETTEPVAERLAELGIPFLFATGYDEAPLAKRFGVGVVRKPATREALQAALAEALAAG